MTVSAPLVWLIIGVAFLIAELHFSGFFLIFFWFGSWVVALLAYLLLISVTLQVLIFFVSSLAFLFLLRKFLMTKFKDRFISKAKEYSADTPIGKTVRVSRKIMPGTAGQIEFRGSYWRAEANTEIEKGESVVIDDYVDNDKMVFRVRHAGEGDKG